MEKKNLISDQFKILVALNQNKRDRRINVPDAGALGAVASRAKLVGRGGVGQANSYKSISASLIAKGALYEDPDFPASSSSIYFSSDKGANIQWKRPHEIWGDPHFFVGGASRFDVCQGKLGNCWLLVAVASLSMTPLLFNQVVPADQGFTKDSYSGAFHFNFWHYGQWKEVIVDDRLPTRDGELVFMHSRELNEFWSALLEKAYAKLYGSYEVLRGGMMSEAMVDFTGGLNELIDLRLEYRKNADSRDKLFQIMLQGQAKMSMMGSGINASPQMVEARLPNGLVMAHAYSVTAVKQIDAKIPGYQGNNIKLVRMRNPWGRVEWNGEWSDKSSSWRHFSDKERSTLGIIVDNDGEFWMSFDDFVNNFEEVEICHLGPQSMGESLPDSSNKRVWEVSSIQGAWKKGVTAGGSMAFQESFWSNPQYKFDVTDPDEDDKENLGTVIIGLIQKNMRSLKNRGSKMFSIGYVIYKRPPERSGLLDKAFFRINRKVAISPSYIYMREVCGRHKLPPGSYVVIPSTSDPGEEADFLLRIFSEKSTNGKELDEDTKMEDDTDVLLTPIQDKEREILQKAFYGVPGDDMEVDYAELKDILDLSFEKEPFFKEFSLDTCRSMVTMIDTDLSGRIGFDEFQAMWVDLKSWKTAFKQGDKDANGSLSSYELRTLLNKIGFRVSNKVFTNLVVRFATKEKNIEFDNFIHCCVRLKTAFKTFKAQRKDVHNNTIIDQDTFIQSSIYT